MSTEHALPPEPAYGHPGTAFAHVFFKVRQDFLFVRPPDFCVTSLAVASTLTLLQVTSVLVYLFCTLFSKSYVANFVSIILLLMFDFWIVSDPFPILLDA